MWRVIMLSGSRQYHCASTGGLTCIVNNFGGLELKKFGMIIEPLEAEL
ncbi:hypothetical protein [Vibrio metoecus]|nr:hypothetical protein [Vibrio metoecus]